ncbi:cytochrome c biogenesis CcdA family protein [Hippea sp. KM1]|uniref:cytochrome c biogenesis CcdA family protein n=1 Tax=Hippea sp. KM1 TaxID=944481 RepID=UPI00046D0A0D|nr:cytochrome c biogenesis CcdA family protein [Hippea sp. KM1]
MSLNLIWGSFFAGILSFFSPCIFPLIPVYISFVTGHSLEELKSKNQTNPLLIFAKTTAFIFGFALIFITMGAASSSIGAFLLTNKVLFAKISGAILIFFGLQLSGIINIKLLTQTKRFTACMPSHGFVSSFVFGIIFAFGWSPCVGPMLSSILILAADSNSVREGIILLSLYSLGIGLPFLIFSLSINYFFKVSKALKRLDLLQKASGIMLILAGVYLIYNGGF